MRHSKFKYQVILFGLRNANVYLKSYKVDCIQTYIDHFMVWYLEDILINSTNAKEHEEHVHQGMQQLKELGLCCVAEKWQCGC